MLSTDRPAPSSLPLFPRWQPPSPPTHPLRLLSHFVNTRFHTLSCAMSPRSAYCGLKQPP